jgi:hypothetical protein
MAITPTYSWPLPDDTDLVKDGAEAIRDLGNAIDTTVGTLPDAGLVHINTTTFSAVASQSINDVFSATYDNYRIVLKVASSAGSDIRLRWRVGGSDNSTASSYFTQRSQFDGTTFNGARTNDTFALFGISDAGLVSSISADIQSPFLTEQTLFTNLTARTGGNTISWVLSGHHNQSTSYDGFSFFPTSGTITGQISVFGYRK